MKKMVCTALMCICLTNHAWPQTQKALPTVEQEAFFETLKNEMQTVKTIQARFLQKRQMALFLDSLESSGILYFQSPNRLRWEVIQSYHSILIYRDNQIAKFDFQNGQVRKLKLGGADVMREILKQIIFWMQGDFSSSKGMYDIAVYGGDDFRFVLTPKSAELARILQSIELTGNLRTKQISKVVIREGSKDSIEIRFFEAKTNYSLDDRIFSLQTPLLLQP